MAGICIAAVESNKQAARRPNPPLPKPASGSCSRSSYQSSFSRLTTSFTIGSSRKVGNVVRQRSAEEKLHREIVEVLAILALIGLFRKQPSLRGNIAHGAGRGLETLPSADGRQLPDVIEEKMPFVQSASGVPVNWTGPQPYCSMRLVRSADLLRPADTGFFYVRVFITSAFLHLCWANANPYVPLPEVFAVWQGKAGPPSLSSSPSPP